MWQVGRVLPHSRDFMISRCSQNRTEAILRRGYTENLSMEHCRSLWNIFGYHYRDYVYVNLGSVVNIKFVFAYLMFSNIVFG